MGHHFSATALLVTICMICPGCVAIGTGHGTSMSIADEIRELKEARDDGEITHEEFQMGMGALHSQTH